jgi:elongation factor G
MESSNSGTVIRAEVPMSEVLTYGTALTSMTQGRGSFRLEMDHYDIVPQPIAEKILAAAKQPIHDEEE